MFYYCQAFGVRFLRENATSVYTRFYLRKADAILKSNNLSDIVILESRSLFTYRDEESQGGGDIITGIDHVRLCWGLKFLVYSKDLWVKISFRKGRPRGIFPHPGLFRDSYNTLWRQANNGKIRTRWWDNVLPRGYQWNFLVCTLDKGYNLVIKTRKFYWYHR